MIDKSEMLVRKPVRPMKIAQLLRMYENKKLNLEPDFQRESVWRLSDRKFLINSIMANYPLPALFFFRNGGRFDVIDGKQRLESILLYMGKLRRRNIEGNRFVARIRRTEDDSMNAAYAWDDLPSECQRFFLNYTIPVIEVFGRINQIHDVFVRINSKGKPLTGEEKTKARYLNSDFLQQMLRFSKRMRRRLLKMRVVSESDVMRMRDMGLLIDLVLSASAEHVIDKKKSIATAMGADHVNAHTVKRCANEIATAIDIVRKVLPDGTHSRFNKTADFYSLVMLFWRYRDEGKVLRDRLRLKQACSVLLRFGDEVDRLVQANKEVLAISTAGCVRDYLLAIRSGSDHRINRKKREKILDELLGSIFEEKDSRRLFTAEQRRILFNSTNEPRCGICNKPIRWDDVTIDHVRAHANGGLTNLRNGQLAHRGCNSRKNANW